MIDQTDISQENYPERSPNYFFKTNNAVENTVYMWNDCIFAHKICPQTEERTILNKDMSMEGKIIKDTVLPTQIRRPQKVKPNRWISQDS